MVVYSWQDWLYGKKITGLFYRSQSINRLLSNQGAHTWVEIHPVPAILAWISIHVWPALVSWLALVVNFKLLPTFWYLRRKNKMIKKSHNIIRFVVCDAGTSISNYQVTYFSLISHVSHRELHLKQYRNCIKVS